MLSFLLSFCESYFFGTSLLFPFPGLPGATSAWVARPGLRQTAAARRPLKDFRRPALKLAGTIRNRDLRLWKNTCRVALCSSWPSFSFSPLQFRWIMCHHSSEFAIFGFDLEATSHRAMPLKVLCGTVQLRWVFVGGLPNNRSTPNPQIRPGTHEGEAGEGECSRRDTVESSLLYGGSLVGQKCELPYCEVVFLRS